MSAPFSETVRINEIGERLSRTLEPDAATRARIGRALDLASLDSLSGQMTVEPAMDGWRLTGRVTAEAVQTCGITLEPLLVSIDEAFTINLVEEAPAALEDEEIEVDLDADTPDVIEDGKIDLGAYLVEQLSLNLDPFPRKPGAEFQQPPEPAEISPFAVLKAFKTKDEDQG